MVDFRQAKALIQYYRAKINSFQDHKQREAAWQQLNLDVQTYGFNSVQDVFTFEETNKFQVIDIADNSIPESMRFVLVNDFIANAPRILRSKDLIPDTFYICYPQSKYLSVSRKVFDDNVNFDYCQKNDIKVFVAPPGGGGPLMVIDKGLILLQSVFKNKSIDPSFMAHLLKQIVLSLGITGVTNPKNDIYVGDYKVGGIGVWNIEGINCIGCNLNINMTDISGFMRAFKDPSVLDKVRSLHNFVDVSEKGIDFNTIFRGVFGKEITLSQLTQTEMDMIKDIVYGN